MQGKRSFLLYCDQVGLFEQLPDEQAGKLIKLIFSYVNDQNPVTEDLLLKIAFEPIKLQLKRDLMNWKSLVERNRINGAKGGRPKGGKDIYSITGKELPKSTKLHYLYLIYDEFEDEFKIGETKDLKERRKTIKRSSYNLQIYDFILIGRYEAIKAEREFTYLFKDNRISGDWFKLSDNDVDKAILYMNTQKTQWDKNYPKKADKDKDKDKDTEHSKPDLPSGKGSFESKYLKFIDYFNEVKGIETGTKGHFKGESKSKKQFKALLKSYNSSEIANSIQTMFRNKHHKETGYQYATPELLTRPEKFERFLAQS